jgi:branched-chain amino acid aminotransferase
MESNQEFVSINGSYSALAEAKIPVLDRGFLLGDQVFETLVGFHGQVLHMEDHLQRLRDSAALVNLTLPWRDEEFSFELQHLASMTSLKKFAIRLSVTRGQGLGLNLSEDMKPNRIAILHRAQRPLDQHLNPGLNLMLRPNHRLDHGSHAKIANYMESILAIDEARRQGCDEVLWYNLQDQITEAATANIFFVAREGDGVWLVTPSLDSGILAGTTRKRLIQLAEKSGIGVEDRVIHVDELPRFDEAFLCSTVRGLIPIQRLGAQTYFTTRKNAVFHHLVRLHQAHTRASLGFAVDWFSGEKIKE